MAVTPARSCSNSGGRRSGAELLELGRAQVRHGQVKLLDPEHGEQLALRVGLQRKVYQRPDAAPVQRA
jgi:hypothetical protein